MRTALFLLACATGMAQSVLPFTATLVTRNYDSAGHKTTESRLLHAVARDGAMVTMDLSGPQEGIRQIIDASAHLILVTPRTRTASSMQYAPLKKDDPGACEARFAAIRGVSLSVERDAGRIADVPVMRVSLYADAGHSADLYLAPSLGCELMREIDRRNGIDVE